MRTVTKWLQEPSYHIVQWHTHSFASMGTVMLSNSLWQYLVSFLLPFLKWSFCPPLLLKRSFLSSVWNCILKNRFITFWFMRLFWFLGTVFKSGGGRAWWQSALFSSGKRCCLNLSSCLLRGWSNAGWPKVWFKNLTCCKKGELPREKPPEERIWVKRSLEFSRSCSTDEITLSAIVYALSAGSKWQKFAYWADVLNHFSCMSEKVLKSVSMSFSRSASAVNSTKRHLVLTCVELTWLHLCSEIKSEHS